MHAHCHDCVLFSFVWYWNDLFYTDLFLQGRNLLQIGLLRINSSSIIPGLIRRWKALIFSW